MKWLLPLTMDIYFVLPPFYRFRKPVSQRGNSTQQRDLATSLCLKFRFRFKPLYQRFCDWYLLPSEVCVVQRTELNTDLANTFAIWERIFTAFVLLRQRGYSAASLAFDVGIRPTFRSNRGKSFDLRIIRMLLSKLNSFTHISTVDMPAKIQLQVHQG